MRKSKMNNIKAVWIIMTKNINTDRKLISLDMIKDQKVYPTPLQLLEYNPIFFVMPSQAF